MPVSHTINPDWLELNLKASDLQLFSGSAATTKEIIEIGQEQLHSMKRSGDKLPYKGSEGPDKISIGHTTFKRKGNGNKFYRDYYTIWRRGKLFGVMLANSRDARLMAVDNMQLQLSNNKLYEDGWLDELKDLMHASGLSYKSAVRLDIAVDGGDYFGLYEQAKAGKIQKIGRAKITEHLDGKFKREGFYVGMSKSKKRLTCYNKSEELKRKNKFYIERFWERNGLDTSTPVQRLELRLKNEESKKFKDLDWKALDQPSHLASLMKANMEKFFEFCEPSPDKNITRRKRIELVKWDELGAQGLTKDSTRPTTELWAAKVTMKKLWEIHYITGRQIYFDIAYEIACNVDGVAWINNMQPHWKKDIDAKLGANRTGEISDSWISRFKEYEMNEQVLIFDPKETLPI